jgi:hypothetical protein
VRAYVGDFRQLCLLALSLAVLQKVNETKLPATLEEVCARVCAAAAAAAAERVC